MVIRPTFVVRNASSLVPGMQRPAPRALTFAPGDRILWDPKQLRLYYEPEDGSYRGVLALQSEIKQRMSQTSTELPGPTTLEQARSLVFTIAVMKAKSLDETMEQGMTVWQLKEPLSTDRPPR